MSLWLRLLRRVFAKTAVAGPGRALTRRAALAWVTAGAAKLLAWRGAAFLACGCRGEDLASLITRPFDQEPATRFSRRHAVDPYRLPRHVVPTHYAIRLEPDLTTSSFLGAETVTVTVTEPTAAIALNAAELTIQDASITNDQGSAQTGQVELEAETDRCWIRFPSALQPGCWRLHLRFTGTLNDKLRGFYRSSYRDQSGDTRLLAATQFEATDARRAFPCWDEPDFKAVFTVTLAIDPALTAVSNAPVVSERTEHGKKVVQFAETIRMSTYLVAIVVGHMEATEPVPVGETPLRVWSVPGKRHLAAYGLEIAAFSLRFFQDYYGIPYSGKKLDLLAIPDFAAGAMENFGAITFRETALLVNPKEATHAELERIADVVSHENAHMWFGDLVTMSWWNGLWLNEAFATFMEILAVDAWKPEWHRWTTFGVSRAEALRVDGLHSTRPIEFPVRAPGDADAMFDVLTYEKGGSVLRMLEQHLGPEIFRDGVRRYLRQHAYGNADTGDLWTAIGEAAKQPVPEVMNTWIFDPGYPLIRVTLKPNSVTGPGLEVRQERFTYLDQPIPAQALPESARPVSAEAQANTRKERRWQVPLQIRITTRGKTATHRILLTGGTLRLDLPNGFESALVNAGGHGFYRVQYDAALLERLLQLVPDGLSPIERFNLVNDARAATLAGRMPLTDYLDLTARFTSDRDKNVWAILIDSFNEVNLIIRPEERPALERLVRDRLGPAVTELGWTPQSGEDELRRQLRADLLAAMGTIGNDPAVQQRAAELYAEYANAAASGQPSPLDPNLLPAMITILAYTGEAARYEQFLHRFRKAATPQEERRFLYSLAMFRQPALLERTLARTINGEVRTQDGPFLVRLMLMNVYGRELAWQFVKANWETMDRLFPKNGLRRLCGGIVGLATPDLERDVRKFFLTRNVDLGGKTLEQYLEQLHILVTLRQRTGTALPIALRPPA